MRSYSEKRAWGRTIRLPSESSLLTRECLGVQRDYRIFERAILFCKQERMPPPMTQIFIDNCLAWKEKKILVKYIVQLGCQGADVVPGVKIKQVAIHTPRKLKSIHCSIRKVLGNHMAILNRIHTADET
eukprot:GHVO01000839.1.p2 GENE.GHVO01000839.1~~GHVO01000839.1.p2  ORF type:complete len:129 (+),score=8.94 GHVO01000839.1:336-722(+)